MTELRLPAKEADIDEVMAEAKPVGFKLVWVEQEQLRGHVMGMVGDGTRDDAPALAGA